MSALVCEHGSLRRKCEICERDGRIKELEARVKELEETLRSLLLIFQTAQGKAIHAAERALCGEGPCKNE